MAYIGVSNTLADATTISAGPLNTNFSDIISGLSDGTKDFNMNAGTLSALTVTTLTPTTIAGTPNFTGNTTFAANVTLGNAVGDTATVSGALAGSRMVLCFPYTDTSNIGSADFYVSASVSLVGECGYTMPRAGSIVGYSLFVNTTTYTAQVILELEVKKNTSTVITGASKTISGTGVTTDNGTAARGTYTFVAGDRIAAFIDVTSAGTIAGNLMALVEVQFDT